MKKRTAWIATTAATAPPLSFVWRSDRYIPPVNAAGGQRFLVTPAYRPERPLDLELFGRRPPPWLARPPFAAISRCFSGLIAAKPRFEPPLFVLAIGFLRRSSAANRGVEQPCKRFWATAVQHLDGD